MALNPCARTHTHFILNLTKWSHKHIIAQYTAIEIAWRYHHDICAALHIYYFALSYLHTYPRKVSRAFLTSFSCVESVQMRSNISWLWDSKSVGMARFLRLWTSILLV